MPLELPHSVWLKPTPRGVARRTDNILDTNDSCNRRRRNSKPDARSSMVGIISGLHEPLFIGCPAALGLSDPLLLDKPRGRSANEIRWRAFCRFADNRWGCSSRHCRGSHSLQCANADELSSGFGWCMRWNPSGRPAVRLYAFSAPTTDVHPAIPRVDSHNPPDAEATGAWHNFSDRPRHNLYSCGTAAAGGAIRIICWECERLAPSDRSARAQGGYSPLILAPSRFRQGSQTRLARI
jgi:hypothetical protein